MNEKLIGPAIERALEHLVRQFETSMGKKLDGGVLKKILDKKIEKLIANGILDGSQTGLETAEVLAGFGSGGDERIHNGILHQDINSLEEARKAAVEMVQAGGKYRIPSCEMIVQDEGDSVVLSEEQVLTDGTTVVGRFFRFDTPEEAIESVARILWESSRDWNRGTLLVMSRRPRE